jgi:hypothetical protein
MTVFIRVLESSVDDKPAALQLAVGAMRHAETHGGYSFERSPDSFASVPGSPFAYWVSENISALFSKYEAFEKPERVALGGLKTLNDERFVRLGWEVVIGAAGWTPLAKGGAFSRFYADLHLLVDWRAEGADISWYGYQRRPREGFGAATRGAHAYFRPGLTWPRRTNGLSFRVLPRGCIFGDKGPAAFVDGDSVDSLLALVALLNSQVLGYLVAVQLARTELAQSFEVGIIQRTPVPGLTPTEIGVLAKLARRAWSLKRSLDTTNEISHAFLLPAAVNNIAQDPIDQELANIQKQIDDEVFRLYGIDAADRAAIEKSTTSGATALEHVEAPANGVADPTDEDVEADDETVVGGGSDALSSWLVGVAFGRFDPRLATGERRLPADPEPFAPLPSRSPGMYPEGEEPADRPDILVDDEGHAGDLATRAQFVAERVKVDAPENLRAWLVKDFFPLHIKMYSKSRRKAPIYWQLATPSAGYSVWLYIHAFSKDTLFRVQNDYVAPKLAHEERRLESLTSELRDAATAAQRKTLATQEAVVDELRAFLDEVKRVAPLWKPNLDDGVIINFAPLWRLVPQNKAWQKELKSTWDALCEGKYDWAHLAMQLWPERVVPKCAKDRSLAIAHGLEEVFWVEGTDGKWTARKTPTRSVDELVRERTSPAVKSALKSLLEAPAAAGKSGGRRGGGRRKSAAAAEGGDA